jgi:hypothetical protein
MATGLFQLTMASPNAPGTLLGTAGNGGLVSRLDEWENLLITSALTGATGGVLDVYLQTSYDEGTRWVDYAHFAQVSNGQGLTKSSSRVTKFQGVSNFPSVGFDGSPALAANTVIGGPFGQQMRLVLVAGSGTTAGAFQNVTLYGSRSIQFRGSAYA